MGPMASVSMGSYSATRSEFPFKASGDTLREDDEGFSVVLSAPTGRAVINAAARTAIGTIRNDDAPPVLSIAGASVLEGDTGTSRLFFTESLSAASGLPASVAFAAEDGSAVAGEDFTALTPGSLSFAPGETTMTIAIELLGDLSIEDHEQFSIVLSAAAGATIGTGNATGMILNDDTVVRIGNWGQSPGG